MLILKIFIGLTVVIFAAAALTEGEENIIKRYIVFSILAVAGAGYMSLYSGLFVTWKGHVANIVAWLCWLTKMAFDPYDDYGSRRYGARPKDPLGIMTLFVMMCLTGIILEVISS